MVSICRTPVHRRSSVLSDTTKRSNIIKGKEDTLNGVFVHVTTKVSFDVTMLLLLIGDLKCTYQVNNSQ